MSRSSSPAGTDPRPAVWIGHVGPYPVREIGPAVEFFEQLGARTVAHPPGMAIIELRGGTHLVVREQADLPPGATASFDLMVDDLDATRRHLDELGLTLGPVQAGGIHSSFGVTDPSGTVITVISSHVTGPV